MFYTIAEWKGMFRAGGLLFVYNPIKLIAGPSTAAEWRQLKEDTAHGMTRRSAQDTCYRCMTSDHHSTS